jgi:hypothetical protein
VLSWQRSASELGMALVARAEHVEVPASLAQAEAAIGAAVHLAGVMLVLAVVLPAADGADLEDSTLGQGDEAAAGTAVRPALGASANHYEGHVCILIC